MSRTEPWEKTPQSKIHTLPGWTVHRDDLYAGNGAEEIEDWDRDEFIESAAAGFWAPAWATAAEEEGESFSGVDIMDVMPPPPEEARKAARQLAKRMAELNEPLPKLWKRAATAPGKHFAEPTVQDFGHYAAMRAVGHGVSWEDDHPDIGIRVPSMGFYVFPLDDGEYDVSWEG